MRVVSWIQCAVALAIVGLAAAPSDTAAQGGVLGRAKRRAEDAAKRKADEKGDQAVDEAINRVSCTVGDADCLEQAKADGKEVTLVDESGTPLPKDKRPAKAPPVPAKPGAGACTNDAR